MQARLSRASTLKAVVESMKELVPSGIWDCDQAGITMRAMDTCHIALCAMHLPAEMFESYSCPTPMSIGLSLVNLTLILSASSNDDNLVISKASAACDTISVTFVKAGQESDFVMTLMNIDAEALSLPEFDYPCRIRLSSKLLKGTLTDLARLGGDSCEIQVSNCGVKFTCSGDIGTGSTTLSNDANGPIQVAEPINNTFANRHLLLFAKAMLSDHVQISMAPDYPIEVEYSVGLGCVRFYLAPKVAEP